MSGDEETKAGPWSSFFSLLSNKTVQWIAAVIVLAIAGLLAKYGLGPEDKKETTYLALTKVLKTDRCKGLNKDQVNKLLPNDSNYEQETQVWVIKFKDKKFSGSLSLNSAGNKSQNVSGFTPDDKKFIAYAVGTSDTSSSYFAVKADAGRYYRGYQTAHDCEGDIDLQCPYIVGPIDNKGSIDQGYEWIRKRPCRLVDGPEGQ